MTSQAPFQQAVLLHQQGRLAEAHIIYRKLLEDAPTNFQLQYRFAFLLFQQQRHAEAMATISAALSIHSDQPEALMLRGTLLATTGRRKEALADFDRVLMLKQDFPNALFNRAMLLFELGKGREAVIEFDRFLAQVPDSAEAWVNRGVTLQGLGDPGEALSSYNRALKISPAHGLAWQNRGILLKDQGRFEDALESFENATALIPRHAGAWRGHGSALMSLLKFDEALNSFDRAVDIAPNDAAILEERAVLMEARRLFAEIPAGASAAEVWHHRAAFLQIHQRLDDALEALDQSLASDPDFLPALIRKGQVLNEVGRTEEGMAAYRHHAQIAYGRKSFSAPDDSTHKQCHDEEQLAFLIEQGIEARGFYLDPGLRVSVAVNPANAESVAVHWRESNPKIVIIDNLLTEDALEGLRRFCRLSTMWRRSYKDGYLGAMPEFGFGCPLLAQIADELRDVFPSVIGDHGLCLLWGFKYDSRLSGIPVHADQAAVNVNFWIAQEEANRDPESGGLLVWPAKPPPDWDFGRYNIDEASIRAFLAKEGTKPVVIPHRANRAIIFDSDLFHETDRIDFIDGYFNRRINVTMLYGRRTFHGA
jgi:tetratricopeptide (TPR) repeat protein